MEHVIVTGGAGFIGSHLVESLLNFGYRITIIDNFNVFYNPQIKEQNISSFIDNPNVKILRLDITNNKELFDELSGEYNSIIHLAAQAGVRPSITNPFEYEKNNVLGTLNLLEFARRRGIRKFIFSSSSSVYGTIGQIPWNEEMKISKIISPYAATKRSCENYGQVYQHLYDIQFIALRLFTVFGPRQRPDLAIHKFAKAIINNKEITLFGDGNTFRDYTYVGDVVNGMIAALQYDASSHEIINLGNSKTISLSELISVIEKVFGKSAIIRYMPEQPGDVPKTCADIVKAQNLLGYSPQTSIRKGIEEFREWYQSSMK